jgi:hypothetical protein
MLRPDESTKWWVMPPGGAEASSTSTCRQSLGRHGPQVRTATARTATPVWLTCYHRLGRHVLPPRPLATCGHVSPRGSPRWSFLPIALAGGPFCQ